MSKHLQSLLVLVAAGVAVWFVLGRPNVVAPPAEPIKVTAATYIYEKDDGSVPPPVLSALDKLNRQGVMATSFEEDTLPVPMQYEAALPMARQTGLPSLVVSAEGVVLRVVKAPTTEEQVLEAAK